MPGQLPPTVATSSSESSSEEWETVPMNHRTARKHSHVSARRISESLDCDEGFRARLESTVSTLEHLLETERVWERYSTLFAPSRFRVIRAYGIGSPSNSIASCFQLALLILLQRRMRCKRVYFFEPLASKLDVEIVTEFGIVASALDDFSVREEDDGPALFYMPHCDRSLYEQVISMRLPQETEEPLFLANHFSKYCVLHSEWDVLSKSFEEVPFLLYNKDYTRYESHPQGRISTKAAEKSAIVPFHAFNDLAFITITASDRPQLKEHFRKLDC